MGRRIQSSKPQQANRLSARQSAKLKSESAISRNGHEPTSAVTTASRTNRSVRAKRSSVVHNTRLVRSLNALKSLKMLRLMQAKPELALETAADAATKGVPFGWMCGDGI